jgi:hypothetical protein
MTNVRKQQIFGVALTCMGIMSGTATHATDYNGGFKQWAQYLFSDAVCDSISNTMEAHIYTDAKGQPDFGFQITTTVNNSGPPGMIRLVANLHNAEGAWTNTYLVNAVHGVNRWTIDFPEPTVVSAVSDVGSEVTCFPAAESSKKASK